MERKSKGSFNIPTVWYADEEFRKLSAFSMASYAFKKAARTSSFFSLLVFQYWIFLDLLSAESRLSRAYWFFKNNLVPCVYSY